MRPLIGITSSVIARPEPQRPLYGISQAYSAAIERAGGIPVIIPPQSDPEAARAIYDRLDGVLFTGGGDIDPANYDEERLERCGPAEPLRDGLELALARVALQGEKPIFGICRGMQLLNVAAGGTLYQDINTQRPDAPAHPIGDYQGQRNSIGHRISIQPDSPLSHIMGVTTHGVNTFHHQAVRRPGANVAIVAWAEDDIPEGMVVAGHPYAVAVQFHPEDLAYTDAASQRLFDVFVQTCAERAERAAKGSAVAATA